MASRIARSGAPCTVAVSGPAATLDVLLADQPRDRRQPSAAHCWTADDRLEPISPCTANTAAALGALAALVLADPSDTRSHLRSRNALM